MNLQSLSDEELENLQEEFERLKQRAGPAKTVRNERRAKTAKR